MKLDRIQSIHPYFTQLGQVTTFGGDNTDNEECVSVAIDKYENVYCAGFTNGSMTGAYLNAADDAVITKFNRHGELQWVVQLNTATVNSFNGGDATLVDSCLSVAVDRHQNVYCGGKTQSNLGGPGTYQGTFQSDAFFVKINPAGKISTIKQFGAVGVDRADSCNGIAVDSAAKIYCAGVTAGNLGEINAQVAGTSDMFIGKFNGDGTNIWIRQLGSVSKVLPLDPNVNKGSDYCNAVLLSQDEKTVYCAGYSTAVVATTVSNGGRDMVIISMNTSDGQNLKGVQDGSTSADECFSIARDYSGNIYCAGTVVGNGFVFNTDTTEDFGILKTTSTLNILSKFRITSSGIANDRLKGIAVDLRGSIYLGGNSEGDIAGNTDMSGNGILIKLSPQGSVIWQRAIGDPFFPDAVRAIAVDKDYNVYGAGYTQNSLGESFAGGTGDILLFRVDPDGNE